ncbi:MAG: SDR family oxidoreductase [Pseudomonadota bacterium]
MIKKILLLLLLAILAGAAYLYSSMLANIPESRLQLQPAQMVASSEAPVLLFGATRNTGLELAKKLHARGEKVVAFVRPTSDRSALEALDAEFLEGDAMDEASVMAAAQSQPFRAVVTTVGCLKCVPPVDFTGNRHIIDAAKTAGIDRVLLVTTIGAGDSVDVLPLPSKQILKEILPLKTQAEDHLRASGLNHIIIRPGGLLSGQASGSGMLSDAPEAFGYIDRSDLAGLMLACLDSSACDGKTLAAIDSERKTYW